MQRPPSGAGSLPAQQNTTLHSNSTTACHNRPQHGAGQCTTTPQHIYNTHRTHVSGSQHSTAQHLHPTHAALSQHGMLAHLDDGDTAPQHTYSAPQHVATHHSAAQWRTL